MSPGPSITHRGEEIPHNPDLPNLLQFLSSTQIKQFRECNRKWAFSVLRKIDVQQTAAMGFGSEVHAVLEEYAKTGVPFDPKQSRAHTVAAEGLQYLPEWGTDFMPEVSLADPTQGPQLFFGRLPFASYIDLFVPARPGELPLVLDYKSTSGLYWAKSEAQLRGDVQAISYGRWGLEKSYQIDWADTASLSSYTVRVKFPYLLTKPTKGGKNSLCTDFVLTAADILGPWAGFERDAEQMLALALQAEAGTLADEFVKPNFSSCDSYGGCPHRVRCAAIAKDALSSQLVQLKLKKEAEMSVEIAVVEPVLGPESEEGFDLLIDAVPLSAGRPVLLLETYLAELNTQIVLDYNAAKGANYQDVLEFPFAAWKGPLRALLVASPPKGLVVARSQGETAQVALEVLRPLARTLVQGVR